MQKSFDEVKEELGKTKADLEVSRKRLDGFTQVKRKRNERHRRNRLQSLEEKIRRGSK